jgi:capsular polysaccharide biosynthesis protein
MMFLTLLFFDVLSISVPVMIWLGVSTYQTLLQTQQVIERIKVEERERERIHQLKLSVATGREQLDQIVDAHIRQMGLTQQNEITQRIRELQKQYAQITADLRELDKPEPDPS